MSKIVCGSWEELANFISDGVPIRKYRSQKSGLTLAMAEIEGPQVNGYFALATEAHDNFGLPHTLEHLIFLGSEDYPYKGVLDSLANRCLASGTNAWTDVDHTAYTVEVAGSEGFLNLLPVYLDHVLYPTLTESGFYTEVHHITSEGQDAGVVYCEMQARENLSHSILHRQMVNTMYPGDCGFKYETGGMMADLRRLTAKQVRDYHKAFYRPDNLCLIINGKIKPEEVFPVLESFEEKIVSKGALPSFERPWSSPVPPFEKTTFLEIPFPTDEEDIGEAMVGWRGPHHDDFEQISALRVMWQYLTDSAVSPLQKALVDTPEPFCSDLSTFFYENSVFLQCVHFESAPVEKLDSLKDAFFDVIEKVVKDGIDMQRMLSVIHREYLKYLSSFETRPHNTLALKFISDFLYGKSNQLADFLGESARLTALKEKDSQFWVALIKKNLLDQPHTFILGKPSAEFAKQLAEDEERRVAAQAAALGETKLQELSKQLEDAVAVNEVQIPSGELEKFPVPDTSKIPFIPIATFRNHRPPTQTEDNEKLKEKLLHNAQVHGGLPSFFVQFDNIPSLFISTTVLLDTTLLEDHYRPYLGLYLDTLFEAPIVQESGTQLSHEEVVSQLHADTLSSSSMLGHRGRTFTCGDFAQAIFLNFKSEVNKYERIVQWMKDFLWNAQFTAERLIITAQKLVNDAAQFKREGMEMASTDILHTIFSQSKSNHAVYNVIKQHRFLSNLLEKLKTEDGAKEVIADFQKFRDALCKPENIRVHVAGNIGKLDDPLGPWARDFVPQHIRSTLDYESGSVLRNLGEIKCSREYHTPQVHHPGEGNVLGLAAIESSYLTQAYPGPTAWDDPDIPPLMVLNEYLTTMEGPFWKQLRGMGLSYSFAIRHKKEHGMLYFVLFKSVSIPKAYQQAYTIVEKFIKKEMEFDKTSVAAAQSSAIFTVVSQEGTAPDAAKSSLLNYLHQAPFDANKRMLKKIQEVTVDDLHRVLVKHFGPLFDPKQTNISITTNPNNAVEIKEFFETKMGKKVKVVSSVDEHLAD